MNVNEAMSTPVKCCSPGTSLDVIARMMWEANCGSIPVVGDDNRPLGIITDRDIAMAAMINHQPLWSIPASHVIEGQHLTCCGEDESIEDCVAKMEKNRVRRILVTDEDGALCGIVSMGDAVAFAGRDTDGDSIPALETGQLVGMLRKVSAHHEPSNRVFM